MSREDLIQQIIEDSSRLKRLALADRSRLINLQLSNAQLEVIHLLFWHEKMTVKLIAGRLGVSLSAVSQLVEVLETEGYIARTTDPADRRKNHLSLTPKAKNAMKRLRKDLTSGFRSALEDLDQKDLLNLNQIYKKLVASASRKGAKIDK